MENRNLIVFINDHASQNYSFKTPFVLFNKSFLSHTFHGSVHLRSIYIYTYIINQPKYVSNIPGEINIFGLPQAE